VNLAESLTDQFYRWEQRGRGWHLWPYPIAIEPQYRPFFRGLPPSAPAIDDARKPTVLGSLVARFMGRPTNQTPGVSGEVLEDEEDKPEADLRSPETKLVTLTVTLPRDHHVKREPAERLLVGLTATAHPVSFEIIGSAEAVVIQLACAERDRMALVQQLEAYFPDAAVREAPDRLMLADDGDAGAEAVVVDFGLSEEFMRPLARQKTFDVDPLIGVFASLNDLRDGDLGLLQVLFQPTRYPWTESILRAVSDGEGGSFFADAPEMLSLARQKVASPLFAAMIRVAARSTDENCAWEVAQAIGAGLAQLADPTSNELIPLTNDDYDDAEHWRDVVRRQSRRSGMLLSADELVGLVHLPSASVRSERLERQAKKTKAAPASAAGHALVLGENTHRGKTTTVTLSPEHRVRHTYVLGASGSGKSTLLLSMILQDIDRGEGLGVLDPHGDLIDEILGRMPEQRHKDVVLFDPSDEERPVGFNILQAHSELEKNLLSSDLVAIFRRFATSWGDQMTAVLGNAVLAFLESDRGGTLFDLRRFLVDEAFRKSHLATVRDPEVVYFFQKELPLLAGRPQGPILTRLNTFLRPKLVRYVVAQKESRLDLARVMNEGKIFLVKLAQGAIGEENAHLLGALLVSKFHQLVMGRQEQRSEQRRNFWLYIDEFHHFVTPSLASLVSGARKYRLGLILAHQELRQLWDQDASVASAMIANPATRICFRLGDFDAKKLEDGFASFEARDLQNLSIGEAIGRIERADDDFTLRTLPLPDVDAALAEKQREQVIALSRSVYGLARSEIEAELARHHPAPPAAPPTKPKTDERVPEKRERDESQEERAAIPPPPRPERAPRTPKPPSRMAPESLPALGRGGAEHKYLQHLVKRLAEDRGWRATIEQAVLGGTGSIDVAFEKDGEKIACEISVSSTAEQEIGNIQKCLAAGYDQVLVLSSDKKALRTLEDFVMMNLETAQRDRVHFLAPEDFIEHLETLAVPAPREQTVHGYRVKVSYSQVGAAEEQARRQAISRVLLRGSKRVKGPRERT